MVMDYLRACYRVQMRLVADSDTLYWVKWFFAPKGAKVFPYINRTWSSVWRTDHTQELEGIGEATEDREWRPGTNPGDYCGKLFVGDPEWYRTGVPLEEMSKPVPLPTKGCKCPKAGTASGGTGIGVIIPPKPGCPCEISTLFAHVPTLTVNLHGLGNVVCRLNSIFTDEWDGFTTHPGVGFDVFVRVTFLFCQWHVIVQNVRSSDPLSGDYWSPLLTSCCGVTPAYYQNDPLSAVPPATITPNCDDVVREVGTGGTRSGGNGIVSRLYLGTGGTESGGEFDELFSEVGAGGGESGGDGILSRLYVGTGGGESGGDAKAGRAYLGTGGTKGGTVKRSIHLSAITVLTASSGTYVVPTNVVALRVRVVGGGGGGGGCTSTGSLSAAGAGGGAGGYAEKALSVVSGQSFSYAVGAAGGGGAAGAAGSAGGDTTWDSGGSPVLGHGGGGGAGMAAGSSVAASLQGTGGTATGGDVNISGQSGAQGIRWNTTSFWEGIGGSSQLGQGGSWTSSGGGPAAVGYGAGGTGSSAFPTQGNFAGIAGAAGVIIVEEYQ